MLATSMEGSGGVRKSDGRVTTLILNEWFSGVPLTASCEECVEKDLRVRTVGGSMAGFPGRPESTSWDGKEGLLAQGHQNFDSIRGVSGFWFNKNLHYVATLPRACTERVREISFFGGSANVATLQFQKLRMSTVRSRLHPARAATAQLSIPGLLSRIRPGVTGVTCPTKETGRFSFASL